MTFKPAGGIGPQDSVTGTNDTDTDGTTPVYLGHGLMPTAYNITVAPGSTTGAGATIQTVITTVSIPPTDLAPGGVDGRAPLLTVYVSLLDFAVTGTINGQTDNASTHPLGGVAVQLLNSSDPTDLANNANDVAITDTTASNGTFNLAHVPNGNYYVSINEPGGTVPANGFLGSVYGPFTVLNGIATISPPVLSAARQQVTVTVHRNKDDDLSSAGPTLTDDGATAHWVPRLSPTVGTTTDTSVSYVFNNVPDGCWVFNLNPNSGLTVATHFGAATIDSGSHSGNCTNGFEVTGLNGANDATPSYTIDENALDARSDDIGHGRREPVGGARRGEAEPCPRSSPRTSLPTAARRPSTCRTAATPSHHRRHHRATARSGRHRPLRRCRCRVAPAP